MSVSEIPAGTAAPQSQAPQAQVAAPTPAQAQQAAASDLPIEQLPSEWQTYVKRLRSENKGYRERMSFHEQRANDLAAQQEAAARKAAEEQGQFKSLYEQERQKLETERTRYQQQLATMALTAAAVQADIVDPRAVKMIEAASVQIGPDGQIVGVQEAIAHAQTTMPWLFRPKATGAPLQVQPGQTPAAAPPVQPWQVPQQAYANPQPGAPQVGSVKGVSRDEYAKAKAQLRSSLRR